MARQEAAAREVDEAAVPEVPEPFDVDPDPDESADPDEPVDPDEPADDVLSADPPEEPFADPDLDPDSDSDEVLAELDSLDDAPWLSDESPPEVLAVPLAERLSLR